LAAVALLLAAAPAMLAQPQEQPAGGQATPAEVEMGKQAAQEIEQELQVADDPAAAQRIDRIVARLRPYTQRPAIDYQAKLLARGGINAFSLPGGRIYITQSLLEAVESEDELAAVIAHEMAHVALGHGIELARREAKINNKAALAVLAAVLAGKNVDPGNVIIVASLVRTGLLSGYSREAELEADANAVIYLRRAGYHPVAVLTVVEGLARMELTHPNVELGIFQTHPYPKERARATLRQLQAMGLPTNARPVLGTLTTTSEAVERDGRTIGRVTLDDFAVFEPAVVDGDLTPLQRAEQAAAALNRLVSDDLRMYEVRAVVAPNRALVLGREAPLLTILPGDAEFHHATLADLAAKAEANIKLALWQEAVRRAF
jgi:Zn-dependent protease with chaperone function